MSMGMNLAVLFCSVLFSVLCSCFNAAIFNGALFKLRLSFYSLFHSHFSWAFFFHLFLVTSFLDCLEASTFFFSKKYLTAHIHIVCYVMLTAWKYCTLWCWIELHRIQPKHNDNHIQCIDCVLVKGPNENQKAIYCLKHLGQLITNSTSLSKVVYLRYDLIHEHYNYKLLILLIISFDNVSLTTGRNKRVTNEIPRFSHQCEINYNPLCYLLKKIINKYDWVFNKWNEWFLYWLID